MNGAPLERLNSFDRLMRSLIQNESTDDLNGIVTLTDAIKYNVPKEAPFPAGLKKTETSNNNVDSSLQVSEDTNDKVFDNEGGKVEN